MMMKNWSHFYRECVKENEEVERESAQELKRSQAVKAVSSRQPAVRAQVKAEMEEGEIADDPHDFQDDEGAEEETEEETEEPLEVTGSATVSHCYLLSAEWQFVFLSCAFLRELNSDFIFSYASVTVPSPFLDDYRAFSERLNLDQTKGETEVTKEFGTNAEGDPKIELLLIR